MIKSCFSICTPTCYWNMSAFLLRIVLFSSWKSMCFFDIYYSISLRAWSFTVHYFQVLASLLEMGFEEDAVISALRHCNNQQDAAVRNALRSPHCTIAFSAYTAHSCHCCTFNKFGKMFSKVWPFDHAHVQVGQSCVKSMPPFFSYTWHVNG